MIDNSYTVTIVSMYQNITMECKPTKTVEEIIADIVADVHKKNPKKFSIKTKRSLGIKLHKWWTMDTISKKFPKNNMKFYIEAENPYPKKEKCVIM